MLAVDNPVSPGENRFVRVQLVCHFINAQFTFCTLPCLFYRRTLQSGVWQVFPAELKLISPTLFPEFLTCSAEPPNSPLSAALFERAGFKTKQLSNSLPQSFFSLLPSSLPHGASRLPNLLRSRIAEGLLSVATEITSPPESPDKTRFPCSGPPPQNQCVAKGIW